MYLINVNAECHLNGQENGMPGRIINAGRLNPDDLENFIEPGLIVRDIEGKIGERRIYPDINLRCYSNSSAEESPGSPSTMLVIEGSIDGGRWFYPITVNRTDQNRGHSHTGIGRNCRYIYDITILRKGSSSPDIPVDPDAVRTEFNIKPWHTTDEYEICF